MRKSNIAYVVGVKAETLRQARPDSWAFSQRIWYLPASPICH